MTYDYAIPDNSFGSLELEGGTGRSSLNKHEFACLLMLFAKAKKTGKPYAVTVEGRKLWIKLEQTCIVNPCSKFEAVSKPAVIAKEWVNYVDVLFRGERSSNNHTTPSFKVISYSDVLCEDSVESSFNAMFTFHVNKSNGAYFVNTNCAPTKLITGNNTFPLVSEKNAADKSKFFVDMFCLAFRILGQLIDQYAVSTKKFQSELSRSAQNFDIDLHKIQVAAYTKPFFINRRIKENGKWVVKKVGSKAQRDQFLMLLEEITTSHEAKKDGSIDIPSALGYKPMKNTTTRQENPDGSIKSISGLMLTFNKNNRSTYSFGFYAKDIVDQEASEKEEEDNAKRRMKAKKLSREQSQQLKISRRYARSSIRLDLSIWSEGLRDLSVNLADFIKAERDATVEITPIKDDSMIKAKNVERLLREIMMHDLTLGVVFQYVLRNRMFLPNLLLNTREQWENAKDYLKKRGYGDLVSNLMQRQNLQKGESLTALLESHGIAGRYKDKLRDDVIKHTQELDAQGKVLRPGIDIKFPYKVAQLSRMRLTNFYDNSDCRELAYEYNSGKLPNNYDPVAIRKEGQAAGETLARHLLNGSTRRIPIQAKA